MRMFVSLARPLWVDILLDGVRICLDDRSLYGYGRGGAVVGRVGLMSLGVISTIDSMMREICIYN